MIEISIGRFDMWKVIDCHQFISLEEDNNRVVFTPVKDGIVDVVLNEAYGTRIQISELHVPVTETFDEYKHEVCKYINQNLRIVTVGGATNKAGKFMRMHFFIGTTEYKVSDIQYIL